MSLDSKPNFLTSLLYTSYISLKFTRCHSMKGDYTILWDSLLLKQNVIWCVWLGMKPTVWNRLLIRCFKRVSTICLRLHWMDELFLTSSTHRLCCPCSSCISKLRSHHLDLIYFHLFYYCGQLDLTYLTQFVEGAWILITIPPWFPLEAFVK